MKHHKSIEKIEKEIKKAFENASSIPILKSAINKLRDSYHQKTNIDDLLFCYYVFTNTVHNDYFFNSQTWLRNPIVKRGYVFFLSLAVDEYSERALANVKLSTFDFFEMEELLFPDIDGMERAQSRGESMDSEVRYNYFKDIDPREFEQANAETTRRYSPDNFLSPHLAALHTALDVSKDPLKAHKLLCYLGVIGGDLVKRLLKAIESAEQKGFVNGLNTLSRGEGISQKGVTRYFANPHCDIDENVKKINKMFPSFRVDVVKKDVSEYFTELSREQFKKNNPTN